MSRLKEAFKDGKAFIPFITCGDPDLETTAAIVKQMSANGADIIELGIPFSDPTAEGPVIQEAKEVSTPMVFMTYANVVFSYGSEKFISICKEIGIDGLILPDIPYEEKNEFLPICKKYDVDLISLIAPTSHERAAMIAREADGFIYLVSSLGVTGVRSEITTNIGEIVDMIKKNTDIPCAVGFGISTPEQAAQMAAVSDGVIVGSAIVKLAARYGKDAPRYIGEYVRSMKEAIG